MFQYCRFFIDSSARCEVISGYSDIFNLRNQENGASGLALTLGVFSAPAITTPVSEDTKGEFHTMKKLGFTIFAAAVLGLPLCAQEATFRADIPFKFSVSNTTAPAGKYVITAQQAGSPVVLLAGSHSYYLDFYPTKSYTSPEEPKLVFHRYGDQYFLSQISTGSASRDLPMSRVERELTKTAAATGQTRTEIVLAMR